MDKTSANAVDDRFEVVWQNSADATATARERARDSPLGRSLGAGGAISTADRIYHVH
ncbi:MAG: hypothetical protein JO212_15685 [Acetobacteraceae bacterium]|nr:hypothetical protein [Acetobacteraceae bacterium]